MEKLKQLAALDIPESPVYEDGFLDVAGRTSHETTICNVYSYFLNQGLSPDLSALLMSKLLEIVSAKYAQKGDGSKKILNFEEYSVFREKGTAKGRIDIVLESANQESVIFIEAKVYHDLENDLQDYWNQYNTDSNRKVGILLTLNPMSEETIRNENFINITHKEWLDAVPAADLPPVLSVRNFIYFTDFVNSMNRLTKSMTMTDDVKFYFENADKINRAIDTQKLAKDYVRGQIELAAYNLRWSLRGNNTNSWRHLSPNADGDSVYLVIYPDKWLEGNGITIYLEICGEDTIRYETELRGLISENLNSQYDAGNDRKQIASKTYSMNDGFDELGGKVANFIQDDFKPIMEDMNKLLAEQQG